MTEEETLADIDLGLLNIQQHLVRIVVLVSSVLVLQGITLLGLAWMADGFVTTLIFGVIGAIVSIVGLLIWIGNFRAYGTVSLTVDEAKESHPAIKGSDESDSS
jgi:protein-S-isoprenylcysteine O-methyltransferase Ste14